MPFVDEVFRQLDCEIEWHVSEGHSITPVETVATVTGPARKVLLGERVALNILARCSGIATKSVPHTLSSVLPPLHTDQRHQIVVPPRPPPQSRIQKHPRRHPQNHTRLPARRKVRHAHRRLRHPPPRPLNHDHA